MSLQPFDLNLRHLAAVPAIVAKGSISAAAQAVSLSQPALTQGLAKLEAQLGADLFQRRPEGMVVTRAGTMLAERVESAMRHLAGATRGSARGCARPERLITAAQLRSFLALADAGSFLEAASRIGLSQPAIHRAARDLEHELAISLAERRGRGVALNEAGRRMARGARLAAAEIAAAIAEIAQGRGPAGLISVGAMPLCRARLLPMALAKFNHGRARRQGLGGGGIVAGTGGVVARRCHRPDDRCLARRSGTAGPGAVAAVHGSPDRGRRPASSARGPFRTDRGDVGERFPGSWATTVRPCACYGRGCSRAAKCRTARSPAAR